MALLEPFQMLVTGPAPTPLVTVGERVDTALAALEGLQVAAPKFVHSAERRRYHQVGYAVEVARGALERAKALAGV
jgi:hypothetical protein